MHFHGAFEPLLAVRENEFLAMVFQVLHPTYELIVFVCEHEIGIIFPSRFYNALARLTPWGLNIQIRPTIYREANKIIAI
jgi:hypothetical protein